MSRPKRSIFLESIFSIFLANFPLIMNVVCTLKKTKNFKYRVQLFSKTFLPSQATPTRQGFGLRWANTTRYTPVSDTLRIWSVVRQYKTLYPSLRHAKDLVRGAPIQHAIPQSPTR